MTDHRNAPAQPCELKGEGADALRTRTTQAEPTVSDQSAAKGWEVTTSDPGFDPAGTISVNGYLFVPAFSALTPKQTNDSGKSGGTGEFDASGHGEAPGASAGAGEALNPTPQEQAELFQQVAATPMPTTAEIKAALEIIEAHSQRAFAAGFNDNAHDLSHVAAVLDRIAVECIVLETERDEARRQLETIAKNAKPWNLTDVAELVQRAERWSENTANSSGSRTPRDLIGKLIAALNDQVRERIAAEGQRDGYQASRDELAATVHICGCDDRDDGTIIAEAYTFITGWIRNPNAANLGDAMNMLSRLRWYAMGLRTMNADLTAQCDGLTAENNRLREDGIEYRAQLVEAKKDAERHEANGRSIVGTLSWVQELFESGALDRLGLKYAWGEPSGWVAEKLVEHLRDHLLTVESRLADAQAKLMTRPAGRVVTSPRFYSHADCMKAAQYLTTIIPQIGYGTRQQCEVMVDVIATEFLGMKRAG